ncbi:MAG: hypothetical protein A2284_05835 [Deltaproteobacteria bacterium RIFOXYA12_FULL_61_11]|nr:MAG: hypothetical protein A2284_05835 [Deltaproteobacteria bacterium RIFOXYA12_FULL_61_11]
MSIEQYTDAATEIAFPPPDRIHVLTIELACTQNARRDITLGIDVEHAKAGNVLIVGDGTSEMLELLKSFSFPGEEVEGRRFGASQSPKCE